MKPRILICDDDENTVQNLETFFERDYDVTVAYSVPDSLDALKRDLDRPEGERYAVVIVDLEFRDRETGNVLTGEGFKIFKATVKDPFLEAIIYTGTGSESSAFRAI